MSELACPGIHVPPANLSCYAEIYTIEHWLRRTARLALGAVGGSNLTSVMAVDLQATLKQRRVVNREADYLRIVPVPDVLWLATLEELKEILLAPRIWPVVRNLTGFTKFLVETKVEEIRVIRNAIGHNRIATRHTETILRSATMSLGAGIEFLTEAICPVRGRRPAAKPVTDAGVEREFTKAAGTAAEMNIGFEMSEDKYFYYLSLVPRHLEFDSAYDPEQLPVDSDTVRGQWMDLEALGEALDAVQGMVSAVLIPLRGTSFELVWPKCAKDIEHTAVIGAGVIAGIEAWSDLRVPEQPLSSLNRCLFWIEGT